MMKRFTFVMRSGVLLAALSMMPACAAEVVDENGEVEVDAEPPPPQVEVVPMAPYPGALWVGGRWYWRGGRHVWVRGRYIHARPGYRYEAHRWERRGNRWHYTAGSLASIVAREGHLDGWPSSLHFARERRS